MRVSEVIGTIRRRILVNFRVDPVIMQRQLPSPFRPKLHRGEAIAGICLIRLEDIRPKHFPKLAGFSSENAAHRIAVEWDEDGSGHEGVYIPRRDTGSFLNSLAGGRIFPGEHHRAIFDVREAGDRIELTMSSADGAVEVRLAGRTADELPTSSRFSNVTEASAFFETGSLGYSTTAAGDHLDGVVLHTSTWRIEPFALERVESTWFADRSKFPAGSVSFDCALIMRDIAHEWHAAPELGTGQNSR